MWITRDRIGEICIHANKPTKAGGLYFSVHGEIIHIQSAKLFNLVFGYTPKKGSIRECTIEIKDKDIK